MNACTLCGGINECICITLPGATLPAGQIAQKKPSQVTFEEAQELVRAIGRLGKKVEAYGWRNKPSFSPKFISKLQHLVLEGIEAKQNGQRWRSTSIPFSVQGDQ
jgi:hypothetical protein